ncbi:MAG TPA: hypothetical protein VL069_16195, partial [Opitutus sp.]|nr:hypothetical protein [Opitutus sp.]
MDDGSLLRTSRIWWLVLAGAFAWLAYDAVVRASHIVELSQNYGVAVDAPLPDRASSTGYALERRSLVLPTLATDARHWIAQTQAMAARTDGRLRWIEYDNAPAGREVHWASPFRWWMLSLAQADSAVTGVALPIAIERSVLWANPVLFGLLLTGLATVVARRFGVFAAALLGSALVVAFPFAMNFYAGNADHHGAAQASAVWCVLGLLLARNSPQQGRRWTIASGIAGGLGLWMSAASLVPVLIGIGLGGLIEASLPPRNERAYLWRCWGLAGGVTSLIAYLIEYAPAHFGWRLEVNHPLYALAWLGGGEGLHRLQRRLAEGSPRWKPSEIAGWLAAVIALGAAPVAILVGGTKVFTPGSPFLSALHADYIAEFQSLPAFLSGRAFQLEVLAQWIPLIGVLAMAGWLGWKLRGSSSRGVLALVLGPALVTILLLFLQIRWWGLAHGLVFVAAVQCVSLLDQPPFSRTARGTWRGLSFLLLLPALVASWQSTIRASHATESDLFHLAERDLAHRLRLRAGLDPLVVASAPNSTTALIYHASARGLGTMYWENSDGLRNASALFSAATFDLARELVARAGVTHLVLLSWDPFEDNYVRLDRGLPSTAPAPHDSFAAWLREGRLPAWLRPLPHSLPPHPAFNGHQMRLFEVTEERPPAVVAADAAAFAIESGDLEKAHGFEPLLAAHPESPVALATLATLQIRRRDESGFRRSVALFENLPLETVALTLDQSIRVSLVLAIG